jgi:thiamine-monophosphate kinase
MLDVTVLGEVARPLPRSGARPGDELWVTGSLGGAASAVADLQAGLEPLPEARQSFERPRPRIREARWIADHADIVALIDVSDGLGRDARHIAAASSVRIDIEFEHLPAHPAVEAHVGSDVGRRLVLGGGEDYELLIVAAPGSLETLCPAFVERFGLPLTRIGSCAEGRGVHVSHPAPGDAESGSDGFDHFQSPNV